MKTKLKLVLGLALVAVLTVIGIGLTGCSTGAATETTSAIQQAPAQSPTANTTLSQPVNVNVNGQQGIWVSGQGKVTVTPDVATVTLGVTVQSSTVADAQSKAATAMNNVVNALTSNGVAKNDIKTQFFNIQQMTRYDNTTQQSVVTGYQVSNMVTAKIRNIDKTGSIIDAVAAAGGDYTRMNGISFSVDQPDQYYAQARQLAMNDAKSKATQLAQLAGVTLGRATYITESTQGTPVPVYQAASGIAASAPVPTTSISPGQTDIILNVQVAYAIQ